MKIQFSNNVLNKSFVVGSYNQTNNKENLPVSNSINSGSKLFYGYRPSFGISKFKLDEFSLICANKFKAPLEKFKTIDDFKRWAEQELAKKTDLSQYSNKKSYVEKEIKKGLLQWKDYLQSDDLYKSNPALALVIFEGLTRDMAPNICVLPPVLNKPVLGKAVDNLKVRIKADPRAVLDFNKLYDESLVSEFTKDLADKTGWIKIPSKLNDIENFEQNCEKLRTLSHKNWCTKRFKSKEYLTGSDFYIYFQKGKPKVCIKTDGNKISEIQGERNHFRLPLPHLREIDNFLTSHKFENSQYYIERSQELTSDIEKIKTRFSKDFQDNQYEGVLEYLGYKPKVLEDGMLELESFNQPEEYTFQDIGLNENEMFKKVKGISGDANFRYSNLSSLGNLEYVNQNADFRHSKLTDLGRLSYVGEDAWFDRKIQGKLEKVGALYMKDYFFDEIPSHLSESQ